GREIEAPVPAALISAVARWHGRDTGTPIPAELNDVVARCKDLFPGFEGGSLDGLQATLIAALDELAGRRRRASLALS
ncbi:hypothetical protein, partial [Escherichia coli]|uniref:hypothetical protein n=1 Tax=Escherichia coli TaxID=562 RepID=UPI001BDB72D9